MCPMFYLVQSYVERTYVVNSQTTALMKVVSGRNGYKIVFLMRFTPIPFGLQNAIFAVSMRYIYVQRTFIHPLNINKCLRIDALDSCIHCMNDVKKVLVINA